MAMKLKCRIRMVMITRPYEHAPGPKKSRSLPGAVRRSLDFAEGKGCSGESQIGAVNIDGRLLADTVIVRAEPGRSALTPGIAKIGEELPVGIELACHAKLQHDVIRRDRMNEH